ncbi:MAG: chemotaxis response regulator protein-glutamate methylesterase [Nitrospirota bacterium]
MNNIKVLVVDDSASNREIISRMLESSPLIKVIGTASDGEEAIEKVVRLKPDFITLDLEMPKMDGFTFLRWLMRAVPTPVLVVSSRADDNSVIRALEFGAVDFLAKPVGSAGNMEELGRDLVEKVRTFSQMEMTKVSSTLTLLDKAAPSGRNAQTEQAAGTSSAAIDVVAIGTSTGGPPALQAILAKLPKEFPAAVLVSQHMPRNFTRYFAERLDRLSTVSVKEAQEGDVLAPGRVLIAPGGRHMTLKRAGSEVKVHLKDSLPSDKYVPSIDLMMKSAASHYGNKTLGVILTGMGYDGREGMAFIKGLGGKTLAESKETAVIYGMPKEAIEAGSVEKTVPLDRMAFEIIRACM